MPFPGEFAVCQGCRITGLVDPNLKNKLPNDAQEPLRDWRGNIKPEAVRTFLEKAIVEVFCYPCTGARPKSPTGGSA
jgi:hypothetical protein